MSLPTSGITTSLVRDTLGETSESAGGAGNNAGKLCSSNKINMWSKYKPVNCLYTPFTTAVDWYYGTSKNMGIKVVDTTNNSELVGTIVYSQAEIATINKYQWILDKVIGTSYSPFRLGDFRGYNHNARPFMRSNVTRSDYIHTINLFSLVNGQGSHLITYRLNSDEVDFANDEITLEMLNSATIGNVDFDILYFAVAIKKSTESNWLLFFQTTPLGQVSTPELNIAIGSGGRDVGTYTVQTFLADGWHDDTEEAGCLSRIFPLPSFSNAFNKWTLTIESTFPATVSIDKVGVYAGTLIPDNTDIRSISWWDQSFWGDESGFPDTLVPVSTYKNMCFKLSFNNITSDINVNASEFFVKSSNTGTNKYALYVQTATDSVVTHSVNKTIKVAKGNTLTLYLIFNDRALFVDNGDIQFSFICRSAIMSQSYWYKLN